MAQAPKALSDAEVEQGAAQLTGWTVAAKSLEKEYRFKDFADALAFVNRLGAAAEEQGHHPDVYLTWGKVRVTLSTHSLGGLSANDFQLAAAADRLV
ncbi:MAG TPA: 4a-hydroxytetrahydrobiopterin dehydratase [Thermoanaerobaculia bacterium]